MPIIKPIERNLLPIGVYPVKVESIIESEGQNGTFLKVTFALLQPQGGFSAGYKLTGIASPTLTPKSKLCKWVSALGIKIVIGQAFDTNDLLNRQAMAVVTHSNGYANITDLLPYNDALVNSSKHIASVQTPPLMASVSKVNKEAKSVVVTPPTQPLTLTQLSDEDTQLF